MLVEIVCQSPQDARNAQAGGASRLELCCALPLGGLTPSLGLLHAVKDVVSLPLMVMVRPRAGDFVYSPDELRLMERDAALLVEHGADGIVFGCLTASAEIDADACQRFLAIANGKQTVFHRAFDCTSDLFSSLDTLIRLGITRVLTSGGKSTALEGCTTLATLQKQAGNRIEILPGGGIRPHNVRNIVATTGIHQVHLAPLLSIVDSSSLDFGTQTVVDTAMVQAVLSAC